MQVIIFKDKILYFSICFILVTIFGTLSHEFGHLVVAKILGYDTILHHSSMEWTNEVKESVIEIYIKNESIIEERKPFHNSIQYYTLLFRAWPRSDDWCFGLCHGNCYGYCILQTRYHTQPFSIWPCKDNIHSSYCFHH